MHEYIEKTALLEMLNRNSITKKITFADGKNIIETVSDFPVVAVSEWISVKERLPQEWEEVLVWSSCGFVECAVYIGIPGKWRVTWNHDLMEMDTITHWMPLPDAPKEGDSNADNHD